LCAGLDQAPALAISLDCSRHGVLQAMQFA
jgi:hypothetical protein